jgi:hypothetical protein
MKTVIDNGVSENERQVAIEWRAEEDRRAALKVVPFASETDERSKPNGRTPSSAPLPGV